MDNIIFKTYIDDLNKAYQILSESSGTDIFLGPKNKFGQANGFGTMKKSSGEIIEGYWVNGVLAKLESFEMNGKWGIKDENSNQIVIDCKYEVIRRQFYRGLAGVKLNGKWGFINKKGEEFISCKFDDDFGIERDNDEECYSFYSSELSKVFLNNQYGFIDTNGNQIISCNYDYASGFTDEFNGLSRIRLADKLGLIDKKGNQIVACKYDDIFEFSDGLSAVLLNNKWGYIDKSGKLVIPCEYDFAQNFYDGIARVDYYGEEGTIDKMGNFTAE